jgi:superfamily I DNA/RNA helicase
MQAQYVRGIGNTMRILRQETAQLNGRAAMQSLDRYFGLLSAYDEVDDEQDEDSKKNFDNEPGKNILTLFDYAGRYNSLRLFYDFTERVRKAHLARTNCLTLSTIHQAKGKEWNSVFVAGVNDEVLPHIKGDPEEEKRIYLVACSRAAKRLQVSANGVASELIKADVKQATAGFWENWGLASS